MALIKIPRKLMSIYLKKKLMGIIKLHYFDVH